MAADKMVTNKIVTDLFNLYFLARYCSLLDVDANLIEARGFSLIGSPLAVSEGTGDSTVLSSYELERLQVL